MGIRFKYLFDPLPEVNDPNITAGELYYYQNCKHRKHYKQHYKGVTVGKCLGDLWNYQEIIHEMDIGWVIETGTFKGGAAYFYADLIKNRYPKGHVVSIDITDENISPLVLKHSHITFINGDTTEEEIIEKVKNIIPFNQEKRKSIFVSFDSGHHHTHVTKELKAYLPLLRKGDYFVIEDGKYYFRNGPLKSVNSFLEKSDIYQRLEWDKNREFKNNGFTSADKGYYKVIS